MSLCFCFPAQRAHEKLLADTAAKEQAYADQHPDLIDENGEMEMPVEDDLFDDGLDGAGRLAKYVAEERKVIENEEMVRKLAKLQRKHNTMQNALLKGNKIGAGYDRDSVDLKVIQRQLKKNKKAEEEKVRVTQTESGHTQRRIAQVIGHR